MVVVSETLSLSTPRHMILAVLFSPSDITKCSFMTRCDQLAVDNQKKACDSMYPQRNLPLPFI